MPVLSNCNIVRLSLRHPNNHVGDSFGFSFFEKKGAERFFSRKKEVKTFFRKRLGAKSFFTKQFKIQDLNVKMLSMLLVQMTLMCSSAYDTYNEYIKWFSLSEMYLRLWLKKKNIKGG